MAGAILFGEFVQKILEFGGIIRSVLKFGNKRLGRFELLGIPFQMKPARPTLRS